MHVRSHALLVSLALAGAALGGCAQQVGDIDRTQPNKIEKTAFDGEWYMRQTVVDVNGTATSTFTGLQGDLERIQFEVREDFLVARRTYEDMFGSDTANIGVPDEIDYDGGQPVAAWAIRMHFDVQRQYNAATGEQMNVIIENNFDRPWFEREYMRPDFSRNWVDTLINPMMSTQTVSNISYLPQNDNTDEEDITWYIERNEEGEVNYIDIVNQYVVAPDLIDCILTMGLPWWGGACGPETISVRTSFVKIEEESDHIARTYDDFDMNEFGFFRTHRCVLDRRYGCRDDSRILIANLWSIWENDTDGEGNALPYAERTPEPIAYYTNSEFPADLIDETYEIAEEWSTAFRRTVAGAQGVSFDQTPRMFYACLNPGSTDPAVPEEILAQATDDGERAMLQAAYAASAEGYENGVCERPGEVKEIGDLRYSFFNWVNNHPNAPWLGYGPSSADPLTGEIINGNANINGASVDTYAQYTLDIVKVLNGDITPVELGNGAPIASYFDALREETTGIYYGYDNPSLTFQSQVALEGLENDNKSFDPSPRVSLDYEVPEFRVEDILRAQTDYDRLRETAADVRTRPNFRMLESMITNPGEGLRGNPEFADFLARDSYLQSNPLERLEGTDIERRLITPEIERGFGGIFLALQDELDLEDVDPMEFMSPIRALGRNNFHERIQRRRMELLNRNIMMGADFDPYMAGFAVEMKAFYDSLVAEGLDQNAAYDRIWREIRGRLYRGVQEHEVGHTVGLRHNFEASRDALNYHPQYWALRNQTFEPDCDGSQGYRTFNPEGLHTGNVAPERCSSDETAEERAQRSAELLTDLQNGVVNGEARYGTMYQYQYSSIMDYDAKPNTHWSGLGLYDYAAIAYGYADLVEVFNSPPNRLRINVREGGTSYERDSRTVTDMDDVEQYDIDLNAGGEIDSPGDLRFDREWHDYHYSVLPMMFYDEDSAVDTSTTAAAYYTRNAGGETLPFMDFELVGPMARMYDRSLMPRTEAEANGEVIVPFRFCSDEYESSSNDCNVFDIGADDYETLQNIEISYDSYYVVDFFRRQRAGYGLWLWPLYSRVYSRYFMPAIELYQFMVLDLNRGQEWYGFYEGGFDRYLAMIDSVNFLSNVITTPTNGTYVFDQDENMWMNVDDDPNFRFESYSTEYPELTEDDYLELGIEDGARFGFSTFNRNEEDELSYYGFWQFETVSHYFSKLAALESLTNGRVNVLGADTISDNSAFWIPPYILFESEMNDFFGSIITEDFTDIGWCVTEQAGKMVAEPIDMVRTSDEVDTCRDAVGGQVLNPYRGAFGNRDFNIRLNAAIYAAAFFQATLDKGWMDASAIYFCGRGEMPEVREGFHYLEYVDRNGVCYAAIEPDDYDPTNLDPVNTWVGRDMVQQLIDVRLELDFACPYEFEGNEADLAAYCDMTLDEADDFIEENGEYDGEGYFTIGFELDGLVETARFQNEINMVYNNF